MTNLLKRSTHFTKSIHKHILAASRDNAEQRGKKWMEKHIETVLFARWSFWLWFLVSKEKESKTIKKQPTRKKTKFVFERAEIMMFTKRITYDIIDGMLFIHVKYILTGESARMEKRSTFLQYSTWFHCEYGVVYCCCHCKCWQIYTTQFSLSLSPNASSPIVSVLYCICIYLVFVQIFLPNSKKENLIFRFPLALLIPNTHYTYYLTVNMFTIAWKIPYTHKNRNKRNEWGKKSWQCLGSELSCGLKLLFLCCVCHHLFLFSKENKKERFFFKWRTKRKILTQPNVERKISSLLFLLFS